MLTLNSLILTQFKNYAQRKFDFTSRIVGISGLNGNGKTNLLDAIYYLCFTKSYFSQTEALNVLFGADGFRIEGEFSSDDTHPAEKVVCIYRNGTKKELYLNDIAYEKFSSHIGKFPCVIIAPDDVEVIAGSSEERRKYIDTVLCQMDQDYLQQLILYNKVLQQRNSLLKSFAEQRRVDESLLDVLDRQLIEPGIIVYEKRKKFTSDLIPLIKDFYEQIADNSESIGISYDSQLNTGDFADLLKTSREKDLFLQRSNVGVHKDDLSTLLNGRIFKLIASQGQRKSLLFAMKLAEFELLKQNKGYPPLLLLDDVFEKLDDVRMGNLLEWVCVKNSGQVFITDTHEERLKESLAKFDDVQLIFV